MHCFNHESLSDNVIVETGAVVAKDIPSNCVLAGIPARQIIMTKARTR